MSRKVHLLLPLLVVILLASSFSLCFSHRVHPHAVLKVSSQASSRSDDSSRIINVDDFGAKGDGKTDDSKAFKDAWKKACSTKEPVVLLVPNSKYLLKPIKFSGPCKSNRRRNHLALRIEGTIVASDDPSDYKDKTHWLEFEEIGHLAVEGGGTFDGNGKIWWQNSCKVNKSLVRDDCISIVSGSKNIQATDIICGPGHGISIGSLGARNSEGHVSNVFVNRATLTGTTNGLRIKTWQGGSGYAKNIWFQNIAMDRVKNPIIIDQDYCDQKTPCHEQKSAVQISNVIYSNINGTSSSEVALRLDCSESFPCQRIVMQDVNFKPDGNDIDNVEASCKNVQLRTRGKVSPSCSSGEDKELTHSFN
ncbi:hypothetical protein FEM48_Zijuj05G0010900 [Ziziphus jujuba var. spinosa]|uniref:Polygalacturonase-like n=1 Tax=Ziziphus jujuba var. spinosa TaxID=714518 RepID=A0A978VBW7_ZIZJJ|nr:hypothetical protein FEM48_Zijuj05G0010900 [Ziziphus jujuba var. spinosa]